MDSFSNARAEEVTEIVDMDSSSDLAESRQFEQDVLDLLDAPPVR
jgi:hypothetical protein